jgi:hypothetical protein
VIVRCATIRVPFVAGLVLLLTFVIAPPSARAQNDETGNEYRLTLFPSHRITDTVTGFAYLGYVWNPEKEYRTYYLGWPAATYAPRRWVQIWGGIVGLYTDNQAGADKLEVRPFGGVKLFLPNHLKWTIYNFTRYEYRAIEDRATDDWTGSSRVRSRFGVEFPLTSRERAWQPKTFYGLADVEPYYRFDREQVDPLRVRAGAGYVATDRLRVEFIYHAQWTHPSGSNGLSFTDNIYRVNIKLGLTKGIIGRFQEPDID